MEGTVHHTGITVSDLNRSVEFYRDVLGLELAVGPTEVFSGAELARGVGVPGARLRQAIFRTGGGSLELFEYLSPPSPVDRPPPPNALASAHVAFQVRDIQRAVKELEAKGVRFFTPPNRITGGPLRGWTWVYFTDPDGILLELVEIAGAAPP